MTNISRYLILFLMFACNNFPFLAFVTMIYWTSTEVLLNFVAPLDSAVHSFDFEQINVFWTFGFDSVSIVFDSLGVSRSLSELYFSHSIYPFQDCNIYTYWTERKLLIFTDMTKTITNIEVLILFSKVRAFFVLK